MSAPAIAQMISIMLYHKRHFPYYVFTILGGVDAEGLETCVGDLMSLGSLLLEKPHHHTGKGALFSFDPVGSYQREYCRAGGSAASLIQPFLDNQVCRVDEVISLDPLSLR